MYVVRGGRQGPDLGGVNLVYYYDFDQIRCLTRTGADALGSVHCQPTGSMRGRIAHRTSWLASSGPCVVDLQLKKTTTFLELQVDVRLGVERRPCCSSLMLNRCALRDCCIGCAGFGYALATLPRLSNMVPPPHASRWPWFMDARRVLSKPLR